MKTEQKIKHSPLCLAIYNELKTNHVGIENAISMENLALYFGISTRCLRHFLSEIRTSSDLEICVLSGNAGYYCATCREEYKQANKRLYNQAFSILRAARANERKANLHNQGKITDIESEFSEFFKSFMEEN